MAAPGPNQENKNGRQSSRSSTHSEHGLPPGVILHSPSTNVVGTPFDAVARFEYPFPEPEQPQATLSTRDLPHSPSSSGPSHLPPISPPTKVSNHGPLHGYVPPSSIIRVGGPVAHPPPSTAAPVSALRPAAHGLSLSSIPAPTGALPLLPVMPVPPVPPFATEGHPTRAYSPTHPRLPVAPPPIPPTLARRSKRMSANLSLSSLLRAGSSSSNERLSALSDPEQPSAVAPGGVSSTGPMFAAGIAEEPTSSSMLPPYRPILTHRPQSEPVEADMAALAGNIRRQLAMVSTSTATVTSATEQPLWPPAPAFSRSDTSASTGADSDLGSIGSGSASHPSDASCELSSVPSDADEPQTPAPSEPGAVADPLAVGVVVPATTSDGGVQATLIGTADNSVTEADRPPLTKKADSDETIKPKEPSPDSSPPAPGQPTAREMMSQGTSPMPSPPKEGSTPSPPGNSSHTPRRSGQGQGQSNVSGGRVSKPRLIARLSALAARAQPLLTLGSTTSPGGSSSSNAATSTGGIPTPNTDAGVSSPGAERAAFAAGLRAPGVLPMPGPPPRLPSGIAAAAGQAPPMVIAAEQEGSDGQDSGISDRDLEAAVQALARPRAPPPRALRHRRSFPGALDHGTVGFGQDGRGERWL